MYQNIEEVKQVDSHYLAFSRDQFRKTSREQQLEIKEKFHVRRYLHAPVDGDYVVKLA